MTRIMTFVSVCSVGIFIICFLLDLFDASGRPRPVKHYFLPISSKLGDLACLAATRKNDESREPLHQVVLMVS